MRKVLLFVYILLIHFNSAGQHVFNVGFRSGPGSFPSVAQTSDDGYVYGSSTAVGIPDVDLYVVKVDTSGNLLWTRTVGGPGTEEGNSITRTHDGGCALAGKTNSFGAGGFDFYIIKLDSTGNLQWTRTIGDTINETCYSVIQTTDRGYALAGIADNGIFVVRLDSSGNLLWSHTFGANANTSAGVYSIIQTMDSGYALAGIIGGYAPFPFQHILIVKLDASGNEQWVRHMGNFEFNEGYSIIQTFDGSYITVGYGSSPALLVHPKILINKLDTSGNLVWSRAIGDPSTGTGTGFYYGRTIAQTRDSGFVIAGYTQGTNPGTGGLTIIKFNSAENIQWSRRIYGAYMYTHYPVIQTSDGGYATIGDQHLIKLDQNGMACCNTSQASGAMWNNSAFFSSYGFTVASQASSVDSGGVAGSAGMLTTVCSNSAVVSPPHIYTGDTTTFCYHGHANLWASGFACGVTLQWQNNGVDIAGATSSPFYAFASGNYTCTYVNSVGSSISSDTITVNVLPPPVVSITPPGPFTICLGDSITLTSSFGNSYLWYPSNDTTQSITVTGSGSFDVIVTDSNGCSAREDAQVDMDSFPPNALIALAFGSTTICAGQYFHMVVYTGQGYTYQWQLNGTDIPGETDDDYYEVSTVSGDYSCVVSNTCGSTTSNIITIIVNPLPSVSFSGLPDTLCMNSVPVTLTGTPPGGTYNGAGVTGNSFSPSVAGQGSHFLWYSYTDGMGCSNEAGQWVFVDICLGITNLSHPFFEIKIFPNPTRNHFTLNAISTRDEKCSLIITDLAGRVIEKWNSISMHEDFNFGDKLAEGFYLAEVVRGDARKIIRLIKN